MKKEEKKAQESQARTSSASDKAAPVDPAQDAAERELADEELDHVAGGLTVRPRC